MHRSDDGDLQVETNHRRHAAINGDLLTAKTKWSNIGAAQRKETACALMKTGLGALWLARGREETSRARYDHVRDAVPLRASVPVNGHRVLPNGGHESPHQQGCGFYRRSGPGHGFDS
jgi:hypothetical protein